MHHSYVIYVTIIKVTDIEKCDTADIRSVNQLYEAHCPRGNYLVLTPSQLLTLYIHQMPLNSELGKGNFPSLIVQ